MSVKTKFGRAYKDSQGYMRISSMKEGNLDEEKVRLEFSENTATKILNAIQGE